MIYLVNYLDARGELASVKVEASSKQEARWASRIPERRILSVKEDVLGRLSASLSSPGPDAKNQAVFMQTISSSLASGKTVHQAIRTALGNSDWLKVKKDKLENCESLADYLSLFNFNNFAVLMARAAEKSGRFSEALRESSKYLLEKEKIKSEVSTELRTGIIYIILGLGFFIFVPLLIGGTMERMVDSASALIKPNEFTYIMLALGRFFREFGPYILGVLALVLIYRKSVWQVVKRWPFFRLFHHKRVLDRGTQFLNAYKLLREAGFTDSEIIYEMLSSSTGTDRKVYQHIYAKLASSEDISGAFSEDDWDTVVRDGMSVLSEVDDEQQQYILLALLETTHMQNVHAARNVSKTLSRIGFLLMVLSVISAILGFYLPLAGAASNMH
ncbi:MAG: type II secretion system F family protein [Ketobacteraceae bacterium]|nr:type II secretion system F family protein [Ketobacteraceae bacterium]